MTSFLTNEINLRTPGAAIVVSTIYYYSMLRKLLLDNRRSHQRASLTMFCTILSSKYVNELRYSNSHLNQGHMIEDRTYWPWFATIVIDLLQVLEFKTKVHHHWDCKHPRQCCFIKRWNTKSSKSQQMPFLFW